MPHLCLVLCAVAQTWIKTCFKGQGGTWAICSVCCLWDASRWVLPVAIAPLLFRPTPAGRSHPGSLTHVQVLHLQPSPSPLPQRLPLVSRDRNGTCVPGTGAKEDRMELIAISDSCLHCLWTGKCRICRCHCPKALPPVQCLCYSPEKRTLTCGTLDWTKESRQWWAYSKLMTHGYFNTERK